MRSNLLKPRQINFFLILNLILLSAAHAECQGVSIYAHRGAMSAPENSLTSIKKAFDGDWDGAEIDIQQLLDQKWAVHHDLTLGRTTSLIGRSVSDIDSKVWKEVRLKDKNGKVTEEIAPLLDDVLSELSTEDNKVLNVEIKQITRGCNAAQNAVNTLNQGRPNGRWFLTSVDADQLKCVREVDKSGYVGLVVIDPKALANQKGFGSLSYKIKPKLIDYAWLHRIRDKVSPPVGIHVDAATLENNKNLLVDAKALGMPIFTYSLGTEQAHINAIKSSALRTGLYPSGAIIDGDPNDFCNKMSK